MVAHSHTHSLGSSTLALSALSILRINTLLEEMIGMIDDLLTSLPCISPRSTKVSIEQFRDVDKIPIDKILPRFRNLCGVVEIGDQRIRI